MYVVGLTNLGQVNCSKDIIQGGIFKSYMTDWHRICQFFFRVQHSKKSNYAHPEEGQCPKRDIDGGREIWANIYIDGILEFCENQRINVVSLQVLQRVCFGQELGKTGINPSPPSTSFHPNLSLPPPSSLGEVRGQWNSIFSFQHTLGDPQLRSFCKKSCYGLTHLGKGSIKKRPFL